MVNRRVQVGTLLPPVLHPLRQLRLARFLEALGFDQLYVPDHTLFPEGGPSHDCWSVMAALACATKRIQFGPAVTDCHRLHPVVMAQKMATLDQLSKGRLFLGLGSGEAMNLEPYGIPWKERKVRKMSEFLDVLRGVLTSFEAFDYDGDFFTLKQARIATRGYKGRQIPISMAALGPMMQKLAGKKADGWLPTTIPVQEYRNYFEPLAEAAREAGRDPDSLTRVATVMACLNTDGRLTEEDVVKRLRPMSGALVWPPVMERLGYEFDPPEEARLSYIDVDPCNEEHMERYWALQRWMPAEMIMESVCYGSVEEITRECEAYVEAGATHLQMYFGAPDILGSWVLFARYAIPRLTGKPPTALAVALGLLLGPAIRVGLLRRYLSAPKVRFPEERKRS